MSTSSHRKKKPRSIAKLPVEKPVPKLTPFRRSTIKFILSHRHGCVFLDPGLGKSWCFLSAFQVLQGKNIVDTMIVVAPLRVVYGVWPAEVEKWRFPFKTGILHGKDKEAIWKQRHKYDLLVINYEGLEWLVHKMLEAKGDLAKLMLVLDESSKVKNTATKRFKLLKIILHLFLRRYASTGSPAPNGLLDLFAQVYLVDRGAALGPYITHYRNQYFYSSGYGGYTWALQHGADKKIYERLKPIAIRFSDDVLNLPPVVKANCEVVLPGDARRAYDDMERDLITQYRRGQIVAANAAAASMKLRQIVSGNVYDERGNTIKVHTAKLDCLVDLIDELSGNPVMVAYEFKHELAMLQKAFPKAPNIGEGSKPAETEAIRQRWNRGDVPVLLGYSGSMSFGLNMQDAPHSSLIWHSLTYNLEHYTQLIKRLHRSGRAHVVRVYHIMAKDTLDKNLLAALGRKDKVQNALLLAIADRAKNSQ